MDPISALAFSCNIIDLLEKAGKTCLLFKELYDSPEGQTERNERLTDVIGGMQAVIDGLSRTEANVPAGRDVDGRVDQSLHLVATRCQDLALKLGSTLKRCKAKKKDSIIAAGKASIRAILYKEDVDQMQTDLDHSCQVLNTLLTTTTQREVAFIQKQLKSVGAQQDNILSRLDDVEHSLSSFAWVKDAQRLHHQVHQQVFAANDLAYEARSSLNRHLILRNLRFLRENPRMDEIHEAASETFGWIIGGAAETALRDSSHTPFRNWLLQGSGIFHVEGKPGSGKSTLMKFITDHEKAVEILSEWAGDKKLVVSKFFIWKLGDWKQKSIKGLKRGLLYQSIQSAPELGEYLCPQFWDPEQSFFRAARSQIDFDITERDIQTAFARLMGGGDGPEIFERFRFCHFIDGLDELDEPNQGVFIQICQDLENWAKAASRSGSGDVKFCVSSRQWPVFNTLASSPEHRMILHQITRVDIFKFVSNTLMAHKNFQKLRGEDSAACKALVDDVVRNANGVFLWVTLVCRSLQEGLSNQDSLAVLRSRVADTPQELDAYFRTIVDSISKPYQLGVYLLFGMVMRFSRSLLGTALDAQDSPKLALAPGVTYVSLLGASLVLDAADNKKPMDHEHLVVPNTSPQQVEARIIQASTQVKGRCKGLLDVDDRQKTIKFVHRTIIELLREYLTEVPANYGLTDWKINEAMIWMLNMEMRITQLSAWQQTPSWWESDQASGVSVQLGTSKEDFTTRTHSSSSSRSSDEMGQEHPDFRSIPVAAFLQMSDDETGSPKKTNHQKTEHQMKNDEETPSFHRRSKWEFDDKSFYGLTDSGTRVKPRELWHEFLQHFAPATEGPSVGVHHHPSSFIPRLPQYSNPLDVGYEWDEMHAVDTSWSLSDDTSSLPTFSRSSRDFPTPVMTGDEAGDFAKNQDDQEKLNLYHLDQAGIGSGPGGPTGEGELAESRHPKPPKRESKETWERPIFNTGIWANYDKYSNISCYARGCFHLLPSGARLKPSQSIHSPNFHLRNRTTVAGGPPLTAANMDKHNRTISPMRKTSVFAVLAIDYALSLWNYRPVGPLDLPGFIQKHDTANGQRGLIDRCYSIVACVRDTALTNCQETFHLLDVVDRHIFQDQWSTAQPPDYCWAVVREPWCQEVQRRTMQNTVSSQRGPFSIIGMACFVGLHEYVEWWIDRETEFQSNGCFATYLLCNVLDGLACAPLHSRLLTLQLLLEKGVSPDLHPSLWWYENHDHEPGPAWHYYLYEVFCELQPEAEVSDVESGLSGSVKYCVDEGHWEAIKTCLRYSKAPVFSVRFRGSVSEESAVHDTAEDSSTLEEPSEPFFSMIIPLKKGIVLPFYMIAERQASSTPSPSIDARISDDGGGAGFPLLSAQVIRSARITLKDIIEYMRPLQRDELLDLLRRSQETEQRLSLAGDYFLRKLDDCVEAWVEFVVGLFRNMFDMFPRQYIISTVSLAGFALVVTLVANRFM